MVKESYVSFETAKLLKEKGFDETCYACYVVDELSHYDYLSSNNELIDGVISAPTQQMAAAWLREIHKLHIVIDAYPHSDGCFYWCYKIMHLCKNEVVFGYYNKAAKAGFDSYEDAAEAAIKYCLTKLI